MRKLFLIFLFFSITVLSANSQNEDKSCFFGITFEVSDNRNWGYGELVVTGVEPGSPADVSGIRVGDIILEIDGNATYLRDDKTISDWLFGNTGKPEARFTIRNMNNNFKQIVLQRKCIAVNSISEKELSSIFSFYSLENTSQWRFVVPMKVEANKDVEFTDYHTYDFYKEEGNVPDIDVQITALLESELQAKGLVRSTENPDIIIQSYYSFGPNPKYMGVNKSFQFSDPWRYDVVRQKMVSLPLADTRDADYESASQYIVEYGFTFYDRKHINPNQLTQIWDCSIKDYLVASYPLIDYVHLHTPLMLKQFPYSVSKTEAVYVVDNSRYYYTGIYFDANDLCTIKDIEKDSPAYMAGLRVGQVVKKINNKKFDFKTANLSEGYRRFITGTMVFRDHNTRFTNAEGFTECMFWDVNSYAEIVKEFNKPEYYTQFSYLYSFENYINSKDNNVLVIEVQDGTTNRKFTVTPEIRRSILLKAL